MKRKKQENKNNYLKGIRIAAIVFQALSILGGPAYCLFQLDIIVSIQLVSFILLLGCMAETYIYKRYMETERRKSIHDMKRGFYYGKSRRN